MTDVGHALVLGALVIAAITAAVSGRGAMGDRAALVAWGRRGTVALATLACGATVALGWAITTSDFSLVYVADHSRRDAPAPYRLAGLWGGMAGSLLFWVAILSVVAVVVARATRRAPARIAGTAQAVMAALCFAFLVVNATLADPFERLRLPAIDGGGLTPILEHPAMLYHPPLLYAGLAATAAPFAIMVAALATGRPAREWLATARSWMLVPWVVLAVGLIAGAHWAYAELGWGGFWGWDPVENAGLLPWLAATAFLHASLIERDRPGRPVATAALAIVPFLLATLGTLLTRSGAATSVHAFAEARAVGRALLALLFVITAVSVVLLARRAAAHGTETRRLQGRDRALVAHVAVVGAAIVVVLIGVLFPLIADLVRRDQVAVSGEYFARFTAPLALVALALIAGWPGIRHLRGPGIAAACATVVALAAGWRDPVAVAFVGLGALAGFSALAQFRRDGHADRPRAAHIAHIGVVVFLMGVAGSVSGDTASATLKAGESLSVGGYRVRHEAVTVLPARDDGIERVRATVSVLRGQRKIATLTPELAVYPDRGIQLAETSLRSTPVDDVQIALRRADDEGRALYEVWVRPLAVWVWWGALVTAAGGALTMRPRHRSGHGDGRPDDHFRDRTRSSVREGA
jgi:cytochrome c-type biogenesis protein CcmF